MADGMVSWRGGDGNDLVVVESSVSNRESPLKEFSSSSVLAEDRSAVDTNFASCDSDMRANLTSYALELKAGGRLFRDSLSLTQVLSCPHCFTTLVYDCVRHATDGFRFVAQFATRVHTQSPLPRCPSSARAVVRRGYACGCMLQAIVTVGPIHMMQSILVMYCRRFQSHDAVDSNPRGPQRRGGGGLGLGQRGGAVSAASGVSQVLHARGLSRRPRPAFPLFQRAAVICLGALKNCHFAPEVIGATLSSLGVLVMASVKSCGHTCCGAVQQS